MNSWTYTNTVEQKTSKYYPRFMRITILQFGPKDFKLTGDAYGITGKTYKTLKGAMAYVGRNYPTYELTNESIRNAEIV